VTAPPLGPWRIAFPSRFAKTSWMRSGSTCAAHAGRPRSAARRRAAPRSRAAPRATCTGLDLDRRQAQLEPARLDARQIEELVDDRQQPLAVLAGRVDEIGLLLRERPDDLLGQQVDRHVQGRQRRAELVGHRRDQVVLQLFERQQPRHVLEDHGRPDHVTLLGVDRRAARQEPALAVGSRDARGLLEPLRNVGALAPDDVAADAIEHGAQRRVGGREALLEADAQQALGALVQVQQMALDRDHDDRIRKAVDHGLGRPVRREQLAERALAVALEPLGHRVELAREPRDLVRAVDARARLDVAFTEPARGVTEHRERTQHARRERTRAPHTRQATEQHDRDQQSLELARRALRGVALVDHRVLVQRENDLGGALELVERRAQLGEIRAPERVRIGECREPCELLPIALSSRAARASPRPRPPR
jgi:hypothetical protein